MKSILFKPDIWQSKLRVLETIGEAQTRRLDGLKEINKEPDKWKTKNWQYRMTNAFSNGAWLFERSDGEIKFIKPRYQIGDKVYIKEAWGIDEDDQPVIFYKLETPDWGGKWQPPSRMLEWVARYFLRITGAVPERLQEINTKLHDEVLKEGYPFGYNITALNENPVVTFARYWDSINPNYPWSSNPWNMKYTLKLEKL